MTTSDSPLLDNDRYTVLKHIQAHFGSDRIVLAGETGGCRYCGSTNPASFRTEAHWAPEALGNKWIFSGHECDVCNGLFSLYDDALANGMAPLLTIGGVKGKGGKVRQTGRSKGEKVLRHDRSGGMRRLSVQATGNLAGFLELKGNAYQLNIPVAGVPFRPRDAYKSLVRMALAILPDNELEHYRRLLGWLQTPEDLEDFRMLEVGLSFGSLGNAPELVAGTLLRRKDPRDALPYIIFLFCAGSACCQIDLMSDCLEDHLPPMQMGQVNIDWTNVLQNPETGAQVILPYTHPVQLNWASRSTLPQPIKRFDLQFDPKTTEGSLTAVLREEWTTG